MCSDPHGHCNANGRAKYSPKSTETKKIREVTLLDDKEYI